MNNKQIMALVGTGVIAFSTVLCWPSAFDVTSSFYRAIFINISNMLISEVPKFKTVSSPKLRVAKIGLTLLGFILLAIGIMQTTSDDVLTIGEWIYFFASVLVCLISLLNFIDIMRTKDVTTPRAIDFEPPSAQDAN